jgi:hypothetical protein
MHHIVAITAFLVCYSMGVGIALSGPGHHDLFGWAMLFGIALAVPSLCFVGLFYLLFTFVRWWATILLLLGAVVIFFYAANIHSEGWNMALAGIIATVVHQLTLLILQRQAAIVSRSIK